MDKKTRGFHKKTEVSIEPKLPEWQMTMKLIQVLIGGQYLHLPETNGTYSKPPIE